MYKINVFLEFETRMHLFASVKDSTSACAFNGIFSGSSLSLYPAAGIKSDLDFVSLHTLICVSEG